MDTTTSNGETLREQLTNFKDMLFCFDENSLEINIDTWNKRYHIVACVRMEGLLLDAKDLHFRLLRDIKCRLLYQNIKINSSYWVLQVQV